VKQTIPSGADHTPRAVEPSFSQSKHGIGGRLAPLVAMMNQGSRSQSLVQLKMDIQESQGMQGLLGLASKINQSYSPLQTAQSGTLSQENVAQLKWEYVDDNLMQWDEPRGGLQWYYSTDSGMMSFSIVDDSPGDIPRLREYEGKPRPYAEWMEFWEQNNWLAPRPAPQDTGQIFGTDIPKDGLELLNNLREKPREEKIRILADAMKAGYRRFDLAEKYGTSDLIREAANIAGVPFDQLTLTYKIMPEKDKDPRALEYKVLDFKNRLKLQMANIPASSQKVLMLHEMPGDPAQAGAYLQALYEVAVQGDAGLVKNLGVSNVSLKVLVALCRFAAESKIMQVKYVENRFSPYEQDTAVREFCVANGITYMGFGLFGGSTNGFCSEGFAMPQRHLQALQDPRIVHLADEIGMPPHQLLLAWARAKGVATVVYSGSRAQENMAAQGRELHPRVIEQMDSFFTFSEKSLKASAEESLKSSSESGGVVRLLYDSIPDPTAWMIFDILMKDHHIHALFTNLITSMLKKYAASAKEAINNLGYRLMRLVAHLQAMVKMGASEDAWPVTMRQEFTKISEAQGEEGVMNRLDEWSQMNYQEVGGATHAKDKLEAIYRQATPKPGDQINCTQLNSALLDESVSPMSISSRPDADSIVYCQYFPNGTTKLPVFKITAKVISTTEETIKVEVIKPGWPF
jgi:diketogulonate reductase-like aldo/keto reductase